MKKITSFRGKFTGRDIATQIKNQLITGYTYNVTLTEDYLTDRVESVITNEQGEPVTQITYKAFGDVFEVWRDCFNFRTMWMESGPKQSTGEKQKGFDVTDDSEKSKPVRQSVVSESEGLEIQKKIEAVLKGHGIETYFLMAETKPAILQVASLNYGSVFHFIYDKSAEVADEVAKNHGLYERIKETLTSKHGK